MARRRIVLALLSALVLVGCNGGPSATPTPQVGATATPGTTAAPTSSAQPTPTPAPSTATPLPEPTAEEIAAWAADICAVNAAFLAENQLITTDIPEPAERSLDALKQVNADREPRVVQAYEDAVAGLDALTPYPGGEAFRQALLVEFQSALDAMPAFFAAIAAATTVEEIDTQYLTRGEVNSAGLLDSAQSVVETDVAFSDAMAAITTGCRFFEFDARARVHGIEMPVFSEVVFEDSFDDESNFETEAFDAGQQTIADGALTQTYSTAGRKFTRVPDTYHDARIETHLQLDGTAPLVGLACRGEGDRRYDVWINQLGLVLIYSQPTDNLLGRRVAPDGFDPTSGVDFAIECLAGNTDPFTLVVYVNGERIAEVQQEHATVSEGAYGMSANALVPNTVATFDYIRVLVAPE
jgi:hypothetical protein